MNNSDFKIGFWGCRGTIAVGGAEYVKYGTNSCCVSMECGDVKMIFDVGTGFVRFEDYYRAAENQNDLNIFLSHYHLDHIEGLPFTGLVFDEQVPMNFYGRSSDGKSPRDVIGTLFSPPYFPLHLMEQECTKRFTFTEIVDADTITLADGKIVIDTRTVNHPGGSTAFRVRYNGKTAVYLSDYEYANALEGDLAEFLHGADVLIFDAYFTDANFREGWGHSTWQEGVYLSNLLDIKQFFMYHHHIRCTDAELDELQTIISKSSDRCIIAREGTFVYL